VPPWVTGIYLRTIESLIAIVLGCSIGSAQIHMKYGGEKR